MKMYGLDASLLAASTCFEVSPEETKKAHQIQANKKLHEAHRDYFAVCSGHERFLSVSSSHVSQFLKALQQGCKSPEESLVDPRTGRMNMSSFSPWYVEVPHSVYLHFFCVC